MEKMMNEWMKKVVDYINNLDRKSFVRYIYIILGTQLLMGSFLLYRTHRRINQLKKELKKVNSLRRSTQELLRKNQAVEEQHKEVDAILDENPNFKLQKYFRDLLNRNALAAGTIETSEITNPVDPAYDEVQARAKLTDITTKQLTQLLQEIEGNPRVHIKKLEITQKKPQTIDVNLTIATLLKK
jgi:hypothetical protein